MTPGKGFPTFKDIQVFNAPLCDIDVFREIAIPTPTPGVDPDHWKSEIRSHRICPPGIKSAGPAFVGVSGISLDDVLTRRWDLRAEAMTLDGRRIFCVRGEVDLTYGEN